MNKFYDGIITVQKLIDMSLGEMIERSTTRPGLETETRIRNREYQRNYRKLQREKRLKLTVGSSM